MLIHLTGCDCVGKTTIAEKLSKLIGCRVVHFDRPIGYEDAKVGYFKFLKELDVNEDVICDRFHTGEHVYAPIYRGYESDYLDEIEAELKKLDYLLVYIKADLDIILERAKVRGEYFVNPEDFEKVLFYYDRFLEKQTMPYITIDTSNNEIDKYINEIMDAVYKIRNQTHENL